MHAIGVMTQRYMVSLDFRSSLREGRTDAANVRRTINCREAANQIRCTLGIARYNCRLGQLQQHVRSDRVGGLAYVEAVQQKPVVCLQPAEGHLIRVRAL